MMEREKKPSITLSGRVGADRAREIRAWARDLCENRGMAFREIARMAPSVHGVPLTHPSIRRWAEREGWAVQPQAGPVFRNDPGRARKERYGLARAETDAMVKCRKRCTVCYKLIEPGEAHVCQIDARAIIFCGGYL